MTSSFEKKKHFIWHLYSQSETGVLRIFRQNLDSSFHPQHEHESSYAVFNQQH